LKGLELARAYYEEYGAPMLETQFPELLPLLAVGLSGSGSECYGYDDTVSEDHDFEPGFCIFIPGEDVVDSRKAFQLERAYGKLPKEFRGISRNLVSPVGGRRTGVIRMDDFFIDHIGNAEPPADLSDWFRIPDYALAEATNGAVFRDDGGLFTERRRQLLDQPRDVMLKKLAGSLLIMEQAGQYNYTRCLRHGETGAAQLAVAEFVKAAMRTAFLLSGRYMPYYKWCFRALRELPVFDDLSGSLEYLLTTGNEEDTAMVKAGMIEEVCGQMIDVLKERNLTDACCMDLEKHAYSVNDRIGDPELRSRSVLYAVE